MFDVATSANPVVIEPGVRGSYWKFVSTKNGGFKVVRRFAPVPSMKL